MGQEEMMKHGGPMHCYDCGADLGTGPRLAFPRGGAKVWFCPPCFGQALESIRSVRHDGQQGGGGVSIRTRKDEVAQDHVLRIVLHDRNGEGAEWAMPTRASGGEAGREFKNQTGGRA